MIVPTGFVCLWFGAAAIVVGVVLAVLPQMGWEGQFVLWAVLSVASAGLWYALKATGVVAPLGQVCALNRRAEGHVGRTFVLDAPVVGGRGKLCIGDVIWRVEAHDSVDISAGGRVTVVAAVGTLLYIEPYKGKPIEEENTRL